MSWPRSSRWVAKECRNVMILGHPFVSPRLGRRFGSSRRRSRQSIAWRTIGGSTRFWRRPLGAHSPPTWPEGPIPREVVMKTGHLLGVEELRCFRVIGVVGTGPAPTASDLIPPSPQHLFVGSVLPLHLLADQCEQPQPTETAHAGLHV